jgi:hypothetical protein
LAAKTNSSVPCGWLVGRKIPRAGKYNQLFFLYFLSRTICVCVFFRSAFSILLGKENIHIVSHLLLLDGDGDGGGRKKGDRRDAG